MLIACIVFGSAVTSFYWTKWMGKLSVVASGKENVERTVHIQENIVLMTLVVLTVAICALFPLMSEHMMYRG